MTDEKRVSDIDALAQEIRRIDGENTMGAGALAEAIIDFLSRRSQQEPDGWRPIETAPKDGSEFIGGRWWQRRFLQDVLKFHPQDGKLRLIHSRYRHRMDADLWRPLPAAPQSTEGK